jgi:GMP synthase (glutamine-hydrolysing)
MITFIDCGSSKSPFIAEIIERFHPVKTVGLNDFSAKDILESSDAIVISGAPILLSEIDPTPYLEKMKWIATFEKPLLGICFGHQLLGMTFGAGISRQREDRDWQTIEVIEPCVLFENLEPTLQMMEDHCESISIPPHFVLSATSDACVNEAMFHQNKPLFGVQFHPEVSGEDGIRLLENFVKLVQKSIK